MLFNLSVVLKLTCIPEIKMKKSLSLVLLLSLTACTQVALAQQTLRFGVDPTFPPFESKAADGRYRALISIWVTLSVLRQK
jgi:lysine/arginine/ornithine transport system substrate-binding protein